MGFTLTVFQITATTIVASATLTGHGHFPDRDPSLGVIVAAVYARFLVFPGHPSHFLVTLILYNHVLAKVVEGEGGCSQVAGYAVGQSWPASSLCPSLRSFFGTFLTWVDTGDFVNAEVDGSGDSPEEIVVCKVYGLIPQAQHARVNVPCATNPRAFTFSILTGIPYTVKQAP